MYDALPKICSRACQQATLGILSARPCSQTEPQSPYSINVQLSNYPRNEEPSIISICIWHPLTIVIYGVLGVAFLGSLVNLPRILGNSDGFPFSELLVTPELCDLSARSYKEFWNCVHTAPFLESKKLIVLPWRWSSSRLP
ncbi:hypothetical protein BJX66DRAFT_16633 [Aspergillus keveii]|uniref:Uncharacterized protein n=1 Tax=Aspergillus keveii TaxID=714993 RepID=A0ABR4FVH5_9EURO